MDRALAAGFIGGTYEFYSCSNLEIYSLRKCYEVEKRSGVYMDVHEHRITEIVTFAALEIFKVE
jgi:hypothetical protein